MGFEHWEVGFRKKMGWEMGLVPPLQDPHITAVKSLQFTAFSMELPPATVIEPIRFQFIQALKE